MKITHKNKSYKLTSNPLYEYFVEDEEVDMREPLVTWNKSPITLELWDKIKAICASTYEDHKSECMIRLFYSEELDSWEAQVHPQEMNGMTVDDEFDQELMNKLHNSYRQCGTVHHHCSTGAFASGTDEKDETNSIGLHITLGNLNKEDWEIHSRFRTPDNLQDPDLLSFIENPSWILEAPEELQEEFMYSILTLPGKADEAPKDWKENCTKKTYQHNAGYGQGYYWNGHRSSQKHVYNKNAVSNNIQSQLSTESEQDSTYEEGDDAWNPNSEDLEACLDLIKDSIDGITDTSIVEILETFSHSPGLLMHYGKEETDRWKIMDGILKTYSIEPADLVDYIDFK